MNQSSVTHYLSSQNIGRDAWRATWRKGILVSEVESPSEHKMSLSNMSCFNFDISYIYFFPHSELFMFVCLPLSPLSLILFGFLALLQNSSQWWTVCCVWKDWSFIKPLLSIKKMNCSTGPHHLESPPAPLPPPNSLSRSISLSLFHSVALLRLHSLRSISQLCVAVTYLYTLSRFWPVFCNCAYNPCRTEVWTWVVFCVLFQRVGPVSAGLTSDLGGGRGLVGVWCDGHQ